MKLFLLSCIIAWHVTVTQRIECLPPKQVVAGSIPVSNALIISGQVSSAPAEDTDYFYFKLFETVTENEKLMRIKNTKRLVYICGSIMILGMGLLSFDATKPNQKEKPVNVGVDIPNVTLPVSPTASASGAPVLSGTPLPSATPTPTPTSTPTPTPSPSPTPTLSYINSTLPLKQLTQETDSALYEAITSYLTSIYSNPSLKIDEIIPTAFYYKKGPDTGNAAYIVYATYDILYKNNRVAVPELSEFFVSMNGTEYVVNHEATDDIVKESALLSRTKGDVLYLYLSTTFRQYMNAKLACDEAALIQLVTDSSYIDIDKIELETQFIDAYSNYHFIVKSHDEPSMAEFSHVVYASYDTKFVGIDTLAPSGPVELIFILDENNHPVIYIGNISDSSEAYLETCRQEDDFLNMKADVNSRLEDALLSDYELLDFYNRLLGIRSVD